MKADMTAYGVRELTPQEETAIAAGLGGWGLGLAIFGILGLAGAALAEWLMHRK
ncbi:hypothetical protein [Mesorhizobium carmichaelinearum]|uniref:hypothetical protein n=1 Tax=Mesorhizobium carmichaelinearum TaxID=1208188 RepID=UPI0015CD5060|nr:hypothetical protein [Mesorhizobium carmichaelinearum]